jgi:hypothetical protein
MAVHPLEARLQPSVQVAARMLWAAVDMDSFKAKSYEEFLSSLQCNFPNVLTRLNPRTVLYFVHLAAGLPRNVSSLVVWVWDEANAVPATEDDTTTFFQDQLSAVVGSRMSALVDKGVIDVLLVPVVASTRGSAMSLIHTASKKAGFTDLRLPLIKSVDDLALIVMDLMRRLPLPSSFTLPVAREQPLCSMSEEVRGGILGCRQGQHRVRWGVPIVSSAG